MTTALEQLAARWEKEGNELLSQASFAGTHQLSLRWTNTGRTMLACAAELREELAKLEPKPHGGLPEPTPAQATCTHATWKLMDPQPRHCISCGLLMWDAGD